MLELLIKLLDRLLSKTITYQEVLVLSNLLWIYHRQVAKQQWIDVSRWGWFTNLVTKFDQVEFQRWAIDIVKDLFEHDHKEYSLPDIYVEPIRRLKDLLVDFINNNK